MAFNYTVIPRIYGFPPLLCEDPRILILGTLPGGESLEHRQYYYSNSNRIPMNKKDELSKKLNEGLQEMKAIVEEGRAALEAKYSPAELRVARNSSKFKRAEDAIKEAEIGIDMLLDAWEDICALNEYLDSGEWQADFEADERGEISKAIPRGVLSEDGLYNALDRLQDVLGQMASIVDHVEIPDKEQEEG